MLLSQTIDVEKIRADFPILAQKIYDNKPLVFLDSAASSQKPRQVIDTITDVYYNSYANVHRGIHYLSEKASDLYEGTRQKIGEFINARQPEEIVFSRNTSESLNLVASSWGLANVKEGDHILATIMEHHSNIVPWQQVAKRNRATLDLVSITDDYYLNMDEFKEYLDNNPKIVAITHTSNVLGTVNPIKEITRLAHEAEAIVVVDGAQSTPHMPIDVQDLDVDFYAVSAHKMLGPTGIGFLYGKYDLLDQMEPIMYGGDMIREVHAQSAKWNTVPFKFETGTPNIVDTIAYGAAIDYLTQIGMEEIHSYEQELTKHAIKRFAEDENIKIIGPQSADNRASVFSFTLADLHPHDIAQLLDQEGVAVRSGHHCAQPLMEFLQLPATTRASFYLYNTIEEVDYLMDAIKTVTEFFA